MSPSRETWNEATSQKDAVWWTLCYLAILVVLILTVFVVKSLEVRVFPAEKVDTAEVRGTFVVVFAVGQLLLPDTDAQEDMPPVSVSVTFSVSSISSLALRQRGAAGMSLTRSELSRVISPGKAHVH